jgi:hypothetical protein
VAAGLRSGACALTCRRRHADAAAPSDARRAMRPHIWAPTSATHTFGPTHQGWCDYSASTSARESVRARDYEALRCRGGRAPVTKRQQAPRQRIAALGPRCGDPARQVQGQKTIAASRWGHPGEDCLGVSTEKGGSDRVSSTPECRRPAALQRTWSPTTKIGWAHFFVQSLETRVPY